MAAIGSANVTYSMIYRNKLDNGYLMRGVRLRFGDGALTYPANGIPLLSASFGLPHGVLQRLINVDTNSNGSADGYLYKWDNVNNTLRIYQSTGSLAAMTELSGSATPTVDIIVEAIGY